MYYPPVSYELGQPILQLIRTSPDSQTILSGIARYLGDIFSADTCLSISSINSVDTLMTGLWSTNNSWQLSSDQIAQLLPILKDISIGVELAAIADLQEDSRFDEFRDILPVQSILGIATYFHGVANGIVMVGFSTSHEWIDSDKELLKMMSEPVAIAFGVVQLQQIVQNSDPADIIKAIKGDGGLSLNLILKKWYEMTRQQLEQQRQLNKLKDEIITTMSHEAKTPLTTMRLAIQMLRQNQLSPESQGKRLDILEKEWHRLNDLITNILTLQKIESQELTVNLKLLNLKPIIHDLAQSYQEKWEENKSKELTLVIEDQRLNSDLSNSDLPLNLYTDPEHIKSILLELITNAGKFAAPETVVSLSISEEETTNNQQIMIKVTNMGACIPAEELKYLFEPFHRGQGVTQKAIAGTGLGLSLVKGLVDLLNGKISATCQPTENSELCLISFTLTLPK